MVSYISIHVPKTAGTTLGYFLDYGTHRRIFWDYPTRGFSLDENSREYFLRHKEFIDKEFEVIHGHFKYSKYCELFPLAKYITCVRHPVQRVISQFKHILGEKNEENHWYKQISDGSIDVVEFASNYSIGNAHSIFLKGRELKDYDFIFITEYFADTFWLFQKMFNFNRYDEYCNTKEMPKLNQGSNRSVSLEVSSDMLKEIYKHTYDDNEIYKESMSLFQMRKQNF